MEDREKNTGRAGLVLTMIIFGSIGIFVRFMSLPSAVITFGRGILGSAFLGLILCFGKHRKETRIPGKKVLLLLGSGAAIGFNWILLFEAYRYTTVAHATLCYYLAPMFVILLSPAVLHEKLTLRSVICVFAALLGMVFVSGAFSGKLPEAGEVRGLLMGVGAAVLYASVVLMNKRLQGLPVIKKTGIQLLTAGLVMLPYILLTSQLSGAGWTVQNILLLLTVGIVHTGIAYALYFASIDRIPAHTAAILSYIDPVVAMILSFVILKEVPDVFTVIGAVLILGASVVSEFGGKE